AKGRLKRRYGGFSPHRHFWGGCPEKNSYRKPPPPSRSDFYPRRVGAERGGCVVARRAAAAGGPPHAGWHGARGRGRCPSAGVVVRSGVGGAPGRMLTGMGFSHEGHEGSWFRLRDRRVLRGYRLRGFVASPRDAHDHLLHLGGQRAIA